MAASGGRARPAGSPCDDGVCLEGRPKSLTAWVALEISKWTAERRKERGENQGIRHEPEMREQTTKVLRLASTVQKHLVAVHPNQGPSQRRTSVSAGWRGPSGVERITRQELTNATIRKWMVWQDTSLPTDLCNGKSNKRE